MGSLSAGDQEGVQRGDYFVPWHIPLHRVEAAAAAAGTVAASQAYSTDRPDPSRGTPNGAVQHRPPESITSTGECQSVSDTGADVAAKSASQPASEQHNVGALSTAEGAFADGRVDRAKGTVVFKRYYHLFDKHELDSLVLQVPGVCITDSFYDKSNWCAVYQKAPETL